MVAVAAVLLAAWAGDEAGKVPPRKLPVRRVVRAPGQDDSNSSYVSLGIRP